MKQTEKQTTTPKKPKSYEGFFYIHLCDISHRNSIDHEHRLREKINATTDKMGIPRLRKHTQYISNGKSLDSTTTAILDSLRLSNVTGDPTPIVIIDESLIKYFEWISRMRYGSVVMYSGNHVDKTSLISATCKYIDLTDHARYSDNQAMRGHETINIIRADFFKFELDIAIKETREIYRFAPCKWLPVSFQFTLRGDREKLIQELEKPRPVTSLPHYDPSRTRKAFEIPSILDIISDYDSTMTRADALSFINKNKRNNKIDLSKQFTL